MLERTGVGHPATRATKLAFVTCYHLLDLNCRGSTGRSNRFREQVWDDIGPCELEDPAAAYRYLPNSGVAAGDGVLISGESYGGYLSLYAMLRKP